ncbi:MAG TPA: carbohydrate binding domain-containing protein [Baekduia sp.]
MGRRRELGAAVAAVLSVAAVTAAPAGAHGQAPHGHAGVLGGHHYYLDATAGDDAAAGTTPGTAWKTLGRLTTATLRPGDTVAFKRGTTFTGSATIDESGTRGAPIRIGAYGSGAAPVLTNPGGLNMLYLKGDRITVSDLAFTNGVAFDNSDGTGITGPKYEQSGAIAIATGADDVTVSHDAFTAVGLGVKTYGLRTRIEHNDFEHLTIAFRGVDSGSQTSYGAVGVSIDNSGADVGWNRFIDCRSTDSPYGADGGAVEIEGFDHPKDDIRIHHNFSSGSQGFVEATETTTSNVELSYNVSDDYQQFLAFDTTTDPTGYKVLHNTVLRHSTLNTTSFFASLYYREVVAPPSADWMTIRDNVFYADSEKVLAGSYSYAPFDFPHDHNVLGGQPDPLGYPLGDGDVIADPRFAALPATGFVTDPAQVAPRADSAAVDHGVTRPASRDILGNPIPKHGATDAGAVQFQGTATPRPEDPVVLGPEQLTADPGFEAQTPGAALTAPWSGTGPVTAQSDAAHGGSVFARIGATGSGFTMVRRIASVTPGQKYRLRMWVKTSPALCATCVYYGVKTVPGQVVREFIAPAGLGDWTELSVDFTPTTSSVSLQLGYYGGPADEVDTDDWSLATRS